MHLKPFFKSDYYSVKVVAVNEEIPKVKTLILEPETVVPCKSGQFLTFVFEDMQGEERRSYSLSGSPELNEPLAITVKRVPNGKYSRPFIDDLKAGDILSVSGASGQFVLPEQVDDYHQVFFFAAGIGIVPVFSIIKTLLHLHPKVQVVLLYSNTSVDTTVFYREILSLHEKFPNSFRPEFLFSSAPDLNRARLSKWLLPQLLSEYSAAEKDKQLFYTCGPFPYMRMVSLSLVEAGYSTEQIRKENFDTSSPALKVQPPDKDMHEVVIVLKGKEYHMQVQYPQSILQAARSHNINLPYSCDTGRCGSCMMYCKEGSVWMSYNEVLTDKDVLQGKVLTCTGYPVNGNVKLTVD
jgi:ring-1,2-phenylacetyl-CoA epoxidase subunit PaaE